jgi:signal transduction histidine kinase
MSDPSVGRRAIRRLQLTSLSLRSKLFLFSASIVLAPGLLLVVFSERSATASLQRVIGRELAREAGYLADRLASVLREERETLVSFAHQDVMREVRVADVDKRISMALATLRDGDPSRSDYVVLDTGGRVVASSNPQLLGTQGTAAPWIAADTGHPFGPFRDPGGAGTRIAMATPIPDPDDDLRQLGRLVGLFDWERLSSVTQELRDQLATEGASADVMVYGPDGALLGGAPVPDGLGDRAAAELGVIARGASVASSDFVVDPSGRWIVGRAVLGPEFLDARLLVVEPRGVALAPVQRLRSHLLLTMGVALAAALAIAALGARRVARPLVELTGAIRGLAHGQAPRRMPVHGGDEVGALAAAFNQMASDLERVQHDLVEAEKFAFVGELAAGIAHQIRTSLGVLRSCVQMLPRSLPEGSDAQVGELALMIREEVGRLENIVSDLLTLDRARPLRLEAIPASEVVFRAAEFVAPQAEVKGIRLRRAAAPRPEPYLRCEPELIYQVALNLLVNAVQALAPGGSIDLCILEARDGFGGFEVRDDGPGMPSTLRERIFQPFVSGRQGGTGLGLTFVKRVVHDHRGRIEVESTPGQGTRFRVELPLAEVPR